MLNDVASRQKKTETIVFWSLIALSFFWLLDTLNDTYVARASCECDMGFFHHIEFSVHLLILVAQIALIWYVRRLFRERRRLEAGVREAVARAEEEKAKSDAVIAAIGDPVTIQGTDYRIIYQNHVLRELVGDHTGEYCYQAYHGRDAVCADCHLKETFAEGTVNTATRKILVGGVPFFFESTASPIRDAEGKIVAGIEVCRDVTKRMQAEEEIRSLNAKLARRATELAAKNHELEAFSYSLSHDLNTPLTKISCAAQTLEESYGERLDDEGRFLIRSINEGSERVEELIDAMLVLARLARREMRREPVDLSALAAAVVSELRQSEPGREVDVVIAPGLVARGDAALLRVVLQNLLGNAWKYTRLTGRPRIEFGAVENAGGMTFYVRDNGAGFDMKESGRLFKPFQRLHGPGEFAGTGIGLATVQRVIERHRGTITAHGEPGHGATFTFTIP